MMMMREQQQQQQKQQHSNNSVMKKKKKKMMRCSFFPSSSQKSSLSDPSRSSSDEIKLLLSLLTFDPCTGSCLHWICPFVPQKIIKKDEERKSWKTNAKTGTARYFEVQCSVERNRVV